MNQFVKIISVFVVSCFFCIGCNQKVEETKSKEIFDPTRDAAKDIAAAVEQAKIDNKNVLLDVGGNWCIWCRRLDEFIESHEKLKKYLYDEFVVVKVNYSEENKNEEVLSRYPKVAGYPHMFVLNPQGELIHSQNTGEFEKDKSYDEKIIMDFLTKWTAAK